MAERLEDRRLLTVTYTIERHDVEGSRVGIYAEFVADAPPTSADVDYGDGTASSLWVDYDANTHTGSVTGLHDYAAPGSYDISTSLRDDDSADSRTFQVTIAEEESAAEFGVIYDSPSPFFELDSAAATATTPAGSAPAVSAVYVSGSAWTSEFKNYLSAQGLGSSAYGFAVPDTSQLANLPWINLNQVSITFSEDVIVDQSNLQVIGSNVASYGASSFAYDPATFTATWTLSSSLGPNTTSGEKVLLRLSDVV